MAIIRPGPIAGAISGRLDGVVFVAGTGSPVARKPPRGHYASSPLLQQARSTLANGIAFWNKMPQTEQQSWRTAARQLSFTNRLGQSSPPNGYNFFIKVWTENRTNGSPASFGIRTGGKMQQPTGITLDFSASGTFDVDADTPILGENPLFIVSGTPIWKNYDSKSSRTLTFLTAPDFIAGPSDVRTEWENLFGPMVENQRFIIGMTAAISNKYASNQVRTIGIVSA